MHRTRLRLMALLLSLLSAGSPNPDVKAQEHNKADQARPLQDDPTALPRECAQADLRKLGRPVIVTEGNGKLLYGFSVGAGHATYGQQVPIYFWLVNPTDQPEFTMTCNMEWFQRDGIDVLDAEGHRMLTIEEQKNPQYRRPEVSSPFNYSCDRNMKFEVAPHACVTPERANDLAERYHFATGQYVIAPRKTVEGTSAPPTAHPGHLVVSIEMQSNPSNSDNAPGTVLGKLDEDYAPVQQEKDSIARRKE